MNQSATRATGGYPLIALFLVLTACGVIAALIGPAVRAVADGKVGVMDAVLAACAGATAGTIVGGVVGLFHYRRTRGFAWGLLVGATIGLFSGPLVLVPRESFGTVVTLAFAGSVVILLISAAFRVSARA